MGRETPSHHPPFAIHFIPLMPFSSHRVRLLGIEPAHRQGCAIPRTAVTLVVADGSALSVTITRPVLALIATQSELRL